MLSCNVHTQNNVSILKLKKCLMFRSIGHSIHDAFNRLQIAGKKAIIVDATQATHLSFSDIGILIDATIQFQKSSAGNCLIAFSGIEKATAKRLSQLGLNRFLMIFDSVDAALASEAFLSIQLRDFLAVLLYNQKQRALSPLNLSTPAPMLDFLGKPIVEHAIDHIAQFGIREFVLCTGRLGNKIRSHLRYKSELSFFYQKQINEPKNGRDNTQGSPLEVMLQMQRSNGVFERETIVQIGTSLTNIDMARLVLSHQSSKADVSFAVPEDGQEPRVLVLSPTVFDAFSDRKPINTKQETVSDFRAVGLKVNPVHSVSKTLSVDTAKTYFSALQYAINSPNFGHRPIGKRIEENVWLGDDVKVAQGVNFKGSCFVGKNSTIAPNVDLVGDCFVGADCITSSNSVIRDCVLTAGTHVKSGAIIDQMIASPDWAVNHNFADGSGQNRSPLDCVEAIKTFPNLGNGQITPFKIAG